jgi:hypothetical protein
VNGLVREGLKDLSRSRVATAIAWAAALAAALAVEAALRTALLDVKRMYSLGDLFHALLVVLLGATVGSLLLDTGRALALTAYAHPGQPFLAVGMGRLPALITVSAVEATVQTFLMLGMLLALPSRAPLAAALLAAPALFLALVMFAAARVGLVLAARGLPPSRALVHGFDVVLRRLPSLVKLAWALVGWTLPLTIPAAVLRLMAARAEEGLATSMARSLSLALAELAALIGYAALANLVGRDPRLTTG